MKHAYDEMDNFVRVDEVVWITGRSRSSLVRDIAAGRFPRPVKIGPRAIAWRASVVSQWMDQVAGKAALDE